MAYLAGVQNRQIMIWEESPLVADMGTPADGCDNSPFKEQIPDAPTNVKVQERGVLGEGWLARPV